MNYTVAISEASPLSPTTGWLWVKPSAGQVYIFLAGRWIMFAGDMQIVSFTGGIFQRSVAVQNTPPPTEVGQIWVQPVLNTAYIFLNSWTVFLGA